MTDEPNIVIKHDNLITCPMLEFFNTSFVGAILVNEDNPRYEYQTSLRPNLPGHHPRL